ncbi:MAG: hypothetical protein LR017_01685 [Candidatus Pacebacteria bacterium]|nr:hypothetical protein [Candidatus Paceibacterota bacterium]
MIRSLVDGRSIADCDTFEEGLETAYAFQMARAFAEAQFNLEFLDCFGPQRESSAASQQLLKVMLSLEIGNGLEPITLKNIALIFYHFYDDPGLSVLGRAWVKPVS